MDEKVPAIWDGKKRLVLWSGGCDSTLALLWSLQAQNARVRTISFTHSQINAAPEQTAARVKLKKKLEKKYGEFQSLECSLGDGHVNSGARGSPQLVLWVTNAVMALLTDEDLVVGYVQGDDVWHFRSELLTIFQACQKILGKEGKILFPLEWVTKDEVIGYLHKEGLLKNTFWCERPKSSGRACGKCVCCKTHSMYMTQVDLPKLGAEKASTVEGM